WNSHGDVPRDMTEIEVRLKDIQYSSRTRAATDQYKRQQKLRLAFASLIKKLPERLHTDEDVQTLKEQADDKVCNIVQLIHHCKPCESMVKDFEFSRGMRGEHGRAGYSAAVGALGHPEFLELPDRLEGVRSFYFADVRPDKSDAKTIDALKPRGD